MYLCIYVSMYLSIYVSIYLYVYAYVYVYVYTISDCRSSLIPSPKETLLSGANSADLWSAGGGADSRSGDFSIPSTS